jgi:hypothetical protein
MYRLKKSIFRDDLSLVQLEKDFNEASTMYDRLDLTKALTTLLDGRKVRVYDYLEQV